jgi:hypothetical protein
MLKVGLRKCCFGGHITAPVEAHNESNSCPLAPLLNADIECNLLYLQDKRGEYEIRTQEEKRPIL